MSPKLRRFLQYLRYLHIYLAMLGLLLMCFFAVTGLMLNHEDWFGSDEAEPLQEVTAALPQAMLSEPFDDDAVVAHLRKAHGLHGVVVDSFTDETVAELVFERPGYRADVSVDRASGEALIVVQNDGALVALMQLHRGRHATTGPWWPWVVDAVAILLMIASLTGLGLLLSLKRHRMMGIAVGATGAVLCLAAYLLLVP